MADYTAEQVADAFLAFCNEHGDTLTKLKLQRLLYYAQGWSFPLRGGPLFDDRIEAWVIGPVVPAVFLKFGDAGIGPLAADVTVDQIDPALLDHVREVWEGYGRFTAWDLQRMSHDEMPWKKARAGLSPDTPSTREIEPADMAEFFAAQVTNGAG